jgi:serine/threonine protein kinase
MRGPCDEPWSAVKDFGGWHAANGCLTEEAALRYVEGELTASAEAIQDHLDVCPICRVLVGEAVLAMGHAVESPDNSPASSLRTLAVGTVVSRRYEVSKFLASGGMGEVYEARDTVLGEVVALKTLVATSLDDGSAMSRLREEVRIARQVTHPNVCRILEFGFHPSGDSAESVPFLTMELLGGETLESRLAREGRLAPAHVAELLEQMIDGLKAIHAAGIVHRDLKPANVFVLPGARERVVLMDFGLARVLDPERRASSISGPAVVGTVDYMAPEQVEGKPAQPSFDIYALGLVVFEMLTGRKPFAGETPLASAVERLTRPPPRPSDVVAALHPAWDQIVVRCLATDPSARFASVDEIATHLSSMTRRGRRPAHGKASTLAAATLGALIALVPLALRPGVATRTPFTSDPPVIEVQHGTHLSSEPANETSAPGAGAAASTPPVAERNHQRPKPRGTSVAARHDSTPTEKELFGPRPVHPRHPDDVINPFENHP